MPSRFPARAQVVVVGGGIVGCSTAYHLARRGWTDVVVLERKTLTSGTTWHAAGLVTQARPTFGTREIVKRSLETFRTIEAETGLSTGYARTGTVHLAMTEDRWAELRRQASMSRASDIRTELLGVDDTATLFPLLNPDGVVGSLYYPDEGRGNATDTTMSLAKGARERGVQIFENAEVTGVLRKNGQVVGVTTRDGEIEADYVVNRLCARMTTFLSRRFCMKAWRPWPGGCHGEDAGGGSRAA